jgi:hypothetical protein
VQMQDQMQQQARSVFQNFPFPGAPGATPPGAPPPPPGETGKK